MDYPAWKKKPSVPRLVQLKNSIWSDQSGENDSLRVVSWAVEKIHSDIFMSFNV